MSACGLAPPFQQIVATVTIRRPVVVRLRIRAEVIEIGVPVARSYVRRVRTLFTISTTAFLLGASISLLASWR